jgi:hypothetical protein
MRRVDRKRLPLLLPAVLALCAGLLPLTARAATPWHSLRTDHYEIRTDLDRDLATDLAQRLEAMYREYSARLVDFRAAGGSEPVFQVYLYAEKSGYAELTGNRLPNSGGAYMAGRNVLAAFLEGQGRDALRRTLQHEAFHQFALTTISPDLPVWLNEGMAQYFEEGIWTGRGFVVGQVPPRRLRQLRADMSAHRLTPFRKFLSYSLDEWNKNLASDAETGATQYNQAWAMVHFLVHGANGNDTYRRRLITMLKLIHGGTSGDDAFRRAFSDNIEGFQSRFIDYANSLAATPEAIMIERQDVLADMVTALSQRDVRFDSISTFRRAVTDGGYRLRYSKGRVNWQTEQDPAVYFTDTTGRVLNPSDLYFDPRTPGPLPDIVCHTGGLQYRTRFYRLGDLIDHEILAEAR